MVIYRVKDVARAVGPFIVLDDVLRFVRYRGIRLWAHEGVHGVSWAGVEKFARKVYPDGGGARQSFLDRVREKGGGGVLSFFC